MPRALVDVVALFDGEHSIGQIQADLSRRYEGENVTRADIDKIVSMLDEHGFLESPSFAKRRAKVDGAFLGATTRPASHAGGSYPGKADELRASMDAFFTHQEGPGVIAWPPKPSAPAVEAIIAPHIDFHRGGPAYAWAYRDLAERCAADLFVIVGTCHVGMRHPFALTRKDYDTPLGPARADRDFVEAWPRVLRRTASAPSWRTGASTRSSSRRCSSSTSTPDAGTSRSCRCWPASLTRRWHAGAVPPPTRALPGSWTRSERPSQRAAGASH